MARMPSSMSSAYRTPGGNAVGVLKGSRPGRAPGFRVTYAIKGAPELSRKLARLSDRVSDEKSAQALLAGAEVLADKWRELVPKFQHHYENSITAVSSPGRKGATGLVYPADVPGLPDNEQPRRYAARLEFGSMATNKRMLKRGLIDRGRFRRQQPSLRPAFDATRAQMVDAIADELRALLR